jgi:hypothetical protein
VSYDSSLGKDFWSIVGSRWNRKGAANALVTPPRVVASPELMIHMANAVLNVAFALPRRQPPSGMNR